MNIPGRERLRDFKVSLDWYLRNVIEFRPIFISYLTGRGESEFGGGNIIKFIGELKEALERAERFSDGGDPEEWIAWNAYQAVLRADKEAVHGYLINPEHVRSIIARGGELTRKYGYEGPPRPASPEEVRDAYSSLADHLEVLGEAFSSRFIHAYLFLSRIMRGMRMKTVVGELKEFEKSFEELYSVLEDSVSHPEEVDYSFTLRDRFKSLTEGFLEGEVSEEEYARELTPAGKALEIRFIKGSINVDPKKAEEYPTWKDFGGYRRIRKRARQWLDCVGDDRVRKMLFSGPPGTGKTLLMNILIGELLRKGYTVVYLRSLEGAELEDLEHISRRIEEYLGVKVAAAVDDLDAVFNTDPSARGAVLDSIERFEYPLLITINPESISDDTAKYRRMDIVLSFDYPKESEIREIAEVIARRLGYLLSEKDKREILKASMGQPGAFIELLIKRRILDSDASWEELGNELKEDLLAARGYKIGKEEISGYQ